jgi:ABC-type sugar transport system substrate-binding protein
MSITAMVLLSLAACGESSPAASSDAESPAGSVEDAEATKERIKAYEPGAEVVTGVDDTTYPVDHAARPYVIGVAFPQLTDPIWISFAYGMEEEAERLGVEVRIVGANGYGDVTGQGAQIDTFITQGVDAILIATVDFEGMAPAIDRAWDEGIPVIYQAVPANSARSMGVYTDDELAGVKQAEYIAENDPAAKVILLCGPAGATFGINRCEGFKGRFAEIAPEGEIVAESHHDMTRPGIAEVAGNLLTAHPDATWVFNPTDLEAKGVVDALRSAGRQPGDIGITNLTMTQELVDLMEEGWINYALSERPIMQGALGVDMAVHVLNGETPPANWRIDLPGFEGTPEEIERFYAEEAKWNLEPEDYTP